MQPLTFEPYLRPQIWGGRALGERLGKLLPDAATYGESWELSTHPHHQSRVASGPWTGATLADLWREHAPELIGQDVAGDFPLLIKFLDCHVPLSVQVHPNDATAQRLIGEPRGKTEAWVVLDAAPAGRIWAGLRPGVDRSALERHLAAGTVEECLHSFAPQPGDCLFIPAGTVHAVGGGVLMAEVQQTSDATFRLFDWNRLGDDGRPRTLHIPQALESIDWAAGPVQPVTPTPVDNPRGSVAGEHLVECPYFTLHRWRLASADPPRAALPVAAERLSIWMLLAGSAGLTSADGAYSRQVAPGDTILVPAATPPLAWRSQGSEPAVLLEVTVSGEAAAGNGQQGAGGAQRTS